MSPILRSLRPVAILEAISAAEGFSSSESLAVDFTIPGLGRDIFVGGCERKMGKDKGKREKGKGGRAGKEGGPAGEDNNG